MSLRPFGQFESFFNEIDSRPFSCPCLGPTVEERLIIKDSLSHMFGVCPEPLPQYDSKKHRPFLQFFSIPKYNGCTCTIIFSHLQKIALYSIDKYIKVMQIPSKECTCQSEFGHEGGGSLSGKPFTIWCNGCMIKYRKENVSNSLVYVLIKYTGLQEGTSEGTSK